jgi:hypothetical protein
MQTAARPQSASALVRPARLALAAVERVATTAQLVTRAALAVLASLRLNMLARSVGGAERVGSIELLH